MIAADCCGAYTSDLSPKDYEAVSLPLYKSGRNDTRKLFYSGDGSSPERVLHDCIGNGKIQCFDYQQAVPNCIIPLQVPKWFLLSKSSQTAGSIRANPLNDFFVVCTGVLQDLVPAQPHDGEPALGEAVRVVDHCHHVQLHIACQFQLYILFRFHKGSYIIRLISFKAKTGFRQNRNQTCFFYFFLS